MKRKYFIKTLSTFLIPTLIPLIILGSLSFYTVQHNLKKDIQQTNLFLLQQSKQQLEMILEELDTLKLSLYQDANAFSSLKLVLRQPSFSYESLNTHRIIMGYLTSITSSKPYIHSIYFYMDNPYNRFVSSVNGVMEIETFHDQSWFEEFKAYEGEPAQWTSIRTFEEFLNIQTEVVTIYHVLVPQKIGIIMNIRPKYIEDLLNDITTDEEQVLFVLDDENEVIFSSDRSFRLNNRQIAAITENDSSFFDVDIDGEKIFVTKVKSERYDWKFLSFIPYRSMYETPNRILIYTVAFSALSFLLGLWLTYILTRRNYRQLQVISSLLESAGNNAEVLKLPTKVTDEYTYIIQNMIVHFLEHRYLKTQLSEKKYRLQFMELLALQSQINPHFLYNTLNSIYWETVKLTGKPNKSSEMIEYLSDLLSYTLSDPTSKVTWEEEIRHTENYINIQKQRYRDKFDCIFEYDEEILQLYTRKLIMQPLVENSLYHGIKEKDGFGLIKVKIYQTGDRLRLVVIDNGIGIPSEKLASLRQTLQNEDDLPGQQKHIGLLNTIKRLRLMYDNQFRFSIKSKPGMGTVIMIEVPVIKDP